MLKLESESELLMRSKERSYSAKVTSDVLSTELNHYGFIECHEMKNFLEFVCDKKPDVLALCWLEGKVNQCLEIHDNGSDYFERLRAIKLLIHEALMVDRILD